MAILQKLNSKANLRKTSGGDLPYQTSYPVIARYEADSTASQTLINMTFSVDQANKESFQLFIDGKLLREGSSNDFTFTSIQADNTSSQITLNAPVDANLNIVAIKLGLRVDSLSSGSSAVSSGGSKNYFSLSNANPDFEKNVTSPWLPCTLTWSGTAPSGAPTLTATNMTLSVSNSNPLSGSYSMLLTKAPVNSQYQGLISSGLTIDREDVAKVLYGSFSYELVSSVPSTAVDFSGTSTQTYEIWVWNYDPANPSVGQWIQPAGYRGMNQSSRVGQVVFSFQTDGAFTNNAYKIAVITQQTGTGAIVVKFDDFVVGPQAIVLGSAMTDWQSYTPILTNITIGNGSVEGKWRRVGDSAEYRISVNAGSTTTYSAGFFSFGIYSGHTIDLTKLPLFSTVSNSIGQAAILKSGTARIGGTVVPNGTTSVVIFNPAGGTAANAAIGADVVDNNSPYTWAGAGDTFALEFRIPIVGWGSASQVSSDTDTRVVAFEVRGQFAGMDSTTNAKFNSITKLIDTHGAYSSSTGIYTVPVSGWYRITTNFDTGTGANGFRAYLYKGGVLDTFLGYGNNGGVATSTETYCNAGEQLSIRSLSAMASYNTSCGMSIERLSGSSVVTATESVNAKYYGCTSPISGTLATMTYANKSFDSHSAYASGIYTLPVSGKFQINAGIFTNATYSASNPIAIAIFNGATEITRTYVLMPPFTGSGNANAYVAISDIISGNAGDQITIKASSGGTSPTIFNSVPISNYFSIARVGN